MSQFDPKINFDFQYPNWAALTGISLVDLLLSTLADIYYNRPCAKCFEWFLTSTSSSANKQDHSPTTATSKESSLAAVAESPSNCGPRDGDLSPNSDLPEGRLEQGLASTDPMVNSVEHYEDYQSHCREKEYEAYEKKIQDHVLLSLRSNHVKLWRAPYYQAEKRNDEALHRLATTIAGSSNEVKEVLLSLRYYQKKSVEFHCKKENQKEEVELCSVAQKVLYLGTS